MSAVTLNGSCLCGAVRYRITGNPKHFWHCHCQRCRKATGTGHASNVLMKPEAAEWTAGEELLSSFKLPDARFFSTSFCRVCGGPLPRIAPDLRIAVIPAGSLDSDPGIRPEGRIYQDSRAAWSCSDTELPAYDTYPSDA